MRKVAEEMNSIVGGIDKLFGFDNDLASIKERLFNGSIGELQILVIVGSGGTGKTALASYLYNDGDTDKHFGIRVWVTMSQDYRPTDLLMSLLSSLSQQNEALSQRILRSHDDDHREMERIVSQCLYGRRYLIVMDDVCSGEVWDYAQKLFPDDRKGSRIMMTTRQLDVAAHYNPCMWAHEMSLMDDDQSWYLLWNRVFGEQGCPLEFELVGRKIARACEGLPLSIVTVAALLSSIPMTLDLWEAISEDVISAIYTKDGQLEKMMHSSFNELPLHLRQCLLYMGGFPKNHELGVSELIKLWVAEGFVKQNGSKTFEEVAEEYVEDLVKTSLVKVVSRKKNGKIKSYSLQNLVRDFCMRKIQEGKFLLPVMDYLPDTILRRYFLPKCLKNQRRVILKSYDLHLRETIHNPRIQTIICIQQEEYLPRASVQKFPLLKVLHVVDKSVNLGWESDHIYDLIHLTYLASNILSCSITASISKLQNLQTLIIYRHNVRLPEEIWRLTKLRHLIAFSFHPLPVAVAVATSPLESLQTLSLVSNFECSEMILKMIPNLKKLGICYSEDTSEQDFQLNNLANSRELRNLKLEVHKDFCFGRELNQVIPVTLNKLSLSGCRLPWKDMTILGSLPNLEALKLRNFAFQGEEWETRRGEFPSLKYLLIDESDLQLWGSQPYTFNELVRLLLYRCPYLQMIPDRIGEISTLQLLEVDGRNESLVREAGWILEEQQLMGNKSFRVEVKHISAHPIRDYKS